MMHLECYANYLQVNRFNRWKISKNIISNLIIDNNVLVNRQNKQKMNKILLNLIKEFIFSN